MLATVRYGAEMSCLFCKIVAGDVPATVIHRTATTLAFRDVAPTAPTHVLVIPVRHIEHAAATGPEDAEVLQQMLAVAAEVAALDGITESGYRLVFNVGPDSGNSVAHLHLHVVGGHPMGWPPFPRR